MNRLLTLLCVIAVVAVVVPAGAVVTSSTTHSPIKSGNPGGLDDLISSTDALQALIPSVLPGDLGWHPANTDPLDQLPAFTDGAGMRGTGLTGLLNDFPGAGNPTKLVDYDVSATELNLRGASEINIHSSNNEDGRIFSTTVISYSMDGGANYIQLGYFQSDPSGTINNPANGSSIGQKATMVSIYDDTATRVLPQGVTNIEFDFYAVDNTQGEMRDPFDGVNPFTSVDDGLTVPVASPLIMEIDVFAVPEPATLSLLALGGLIAIRRRRR